MKKIAIPFQGRKYLFTYYQTTINMDNLFFISTEDKEAIEMMVLDHFFVSFDTRCQEPLYLNCISKNPLEARFKSVVAEAILVANASVVHN